MSSSKDSVRRRELASLTQEEVGFVLCNLGLSKHVGSFARFGVGETSFTHATVPSRMSPLTSYLAPLAPSQMESF